MQLSHRIEQEIFDIANDWALRSGRRTLEEKVAYEAMALMKRKKNPPESPKVAVTWAITRVLDREARWDHGTGAVRAERY